MILNPNNLNDKNKQNSGNNVVNAKNKNNDNINNNGIENNGLAKQKKKHKNVVNNKNIYDYQNVGNNNNNPILLKYHQITTQIGQLGNIYEIYIRYCI